MCETVDEPSRKPPLAEDPDLLASLSDLDRRLTRERDESAALQSPNSSPQITPTTQPRRRPLLELFPPPDAKSENRLRASAKTSGLVPATSPPQPSPPPGRLSGYEAFYGLKEKPFGFAPDVRFLFRSRAHTRILDALASARQNEGIAVVTAADGVGKTMVCRSLEARADRRTLVSVVVDPFVTVEDLLKTILADFGVMSREEIASPRLAHAPRQQLTAAIHDFLASLAPIQASALLVIDEAQNLSIEMFDAVRELSVDARSGRLLHVVFVGQPSLATLLRSTELRLLDERVTTRAELEPLDRDELSDYLRHRLAVAGNADAFVFDPEASAELYDSTHGVPRVVNLVCDRALELACQRSSSRLDADLIRAAAADLQLSPVPAPTSRGARLLLALLMMGFMLAGAAAAAWVFSGALTRTIARSDWTPKPPPPAGRRPLPLPTIPPPEDVLPGPH